MDSKICSKCGAELEMEDPRNTCPVCRTRLEYGICRICHKVVKFYRYNNNVCKECYDTKVRKPHDKTLVNQRRRAFTAEWLAKVAKVPKGYPTLTEEQWLAAVKYFNGCALCQGESIDTRGYFVPFSMGGKYCDWNIIPMCEDCAKRCGSTFNYYLTRPAGLDKITDYLEEKLDAASKQQSNNNSTSSGTQNS